MFKNCKVTLSHDCTFDCSFEKIPKFPGYYAASNGRIYSGLINHFKQLTEFRYPFSKFLTVFLTRDDVRFGVHCHKLVASAFFNVNPDRFIITHKDNDRCNNAPSNLLLKRLTDTVSSEVNSFYESQIKEYEILFLNLINHDSNNPFYTKYVDVKAKKNVRLLYNYLRLLVNGEISS